MTRTTLAESRSSSSLPRSHARNLVLAEFLIGSLDDRGWLATPLEDVAQATERTLADCEKVLKVLQALEPVGVGARDLRECLLIQLEARAETDTLAWRLIHDQFDNLVNRRFPEIARQLKCSVEEVQAAADVVATLNPRPGLQVSAEDPKYVVPDLLVERVDEEYIVMLNDPTCRGAISSAYESVLREKKRPRRTRDAGKTREYIQGKLNSARWLIQTIEQRRRTMIKVMNCIIREQREFFDQGNRVPAPADAPAVARQIDMHDSTVSRVCSGKYVQTPRGVFGSSFSSRAGWNRRTAKTFLRAPPKTSSDPDREEDRRSRCPINARRAAAREGLAHRAAHGGEVPRALSILPARFRRRVA